MQFDIIDPKAFLAVTAKLKTLVRGVRFGALNQVYVTVTGGDVTLACTLVSSTVTYTFTDAVVVPSRDGEGVVDLTRLHKVLSKIKTASLVGICFTDKNTVEIKTGKRVMTLDAGIIDEYPVEVTRLRVAESKKDVPTSTLDASTLLAGVRDALVSVGRDDSRPNLMNISVQFDAVDNSLELMSTDGHRASLTTLPTSDLLLANIFDKGADLGAMLGESQYLVGSEPLTFIVSAFNKHTYVGLGLGDGSLVFSQGGYHVFAGIDRLSFPDIKAVVPASATFESVSLNAGDLLSEVKMADMFTSKTQAITLQVPELDGTASSGFLLTTSNEEGSFKADLPLSSLAPYLTPILNEFRVVVNATYLTDILKRFDTKEPLVISTPSSGGGLSPLRLTQATSPTVFILMPMRL